MTREELREKVAQAMYDQWQAKRLSAPAFFMLSGNALKHELENADAAIALVLEEAARVAVTSSAAAAVVATTAAAAIASSAPRRSAVIRPRPSRPISTTCHSTTTSRSDRSTQGS